MAFIGRTYELSSLKKLYDDKNSRIAVIYGRRRIGKSFLVDTFCTNLPTLKLEGIEGVQTTRQIDEATRSLARQINDPLLANIRFQTWSALFDYLTRYLEQQKQKVVIFLDEIQWLAANQSSLIGLIKMYWDNHWKKQSVLLILCGSVSSYMVRRVIMSKALYGRIDFELALGPLSPHEANLMLRKRRSLDEVFQYLLLLGGIPKYLEMIDTNMSFSQNINELFFKKGSFFRSEYEKVFYSQFREHKTYERIVNLLITGPKSLNEVAKNLAKKSGGSLKIYLENLEKSNFIAATTPYDSISTKVQKYYVSDSFLRFYFKYIKPHRKLIESNTKRNLFNELVTPKWKPWTGLAFETFCLNHAILIAEKLNFADQVVSFGPYFKRGDQAFQADLVYMRKDRTITLCEIKYHEKEIDPSIIVEVERKCDLIKLPRGYTLEKCLISRFGANQALRASGYFHHELTVTDFFNL